MTLVSRRYLSATKQSVMAGLWLFWVAFPNPGRAYSVLTHQAIIDSVWLDAIKPVLIKRYPDVTEDELLEAIKILFIPYCVESSLPH